MTSSLRPVVHVEAAVPLHEAIDIGQPEPGPPQPIYLRMTPIHALPSGDEIKVSD